MGITEVEQIVNLGRGKRLDELLESLHLMPGHQAKLFRVLM